MKVHITNSDGRNTERGLVKLRIHTKNTAVWVVKPYSLLETCRSLDGTYFIKLQALWWNVLLPTSGDLVERTSSKFTRFHGTYCFQVQAFWWNALLPTSGVFMEPTASNFRHFGGTISSNFRRLHGTYCFQI